MAPSRTLPRVTPWPLALALTVLALIVVIALPASASARAWTTFKQVTGDPGGGRTVTGAKLASDAAGNQVAIWIEQPSPFKVMASFRPAGGDWGAPQTLDNLATTAPTTDLAVDKNGDFIAVYSEVIAGVGVKVLSSYLPAGQTAFEAPEQLGATLGSAVTITAPAVAFADNGRAFAAYGVTGATNVAGIRTAGSGQKWTLVSTGLPTGSGGLDLAVSPLGEATIVDYPSGGGALRHYRLQNGGATWTALTTPAGVGNPTGTPLLGVDELGRTTTVYLVASTFTGIATQTCPASIPATCTARVDLPRLGGSTVSAGAPSLAVSKSGDAVAAWTENGAVAVSRRTGFTGTFSAPANAGQGATPTVRFDSVESLVALYEQTANVISFLFAAPGVTPVGPGSPATDPALGWKAPTAATDGNGDVFGAWVSSSGTAIQSAVYDALAPAFNSLNISATTVTTGDVVSFSADAPDTWSGVSYAWDFGDGGTATGPSVSHAYAASGAYTARVTATDGAGNTSSRTQTITVGSSSSQPIKGLARPVAGKNVNIEPVTGEVLVQVPGSNKFVPLVAPAQIQDGAIIDARKGRVRITIDNGRGGLDTAEFYGGIFKFTQPKVKPGQTWFANLYLYGGSFKGCPAAPKNPKIATLSRKQGKRQSQGKSVRQLWGSGEGAFRTVGRFSSATVRGTTWLTNDRCNGTLTKVTTGKVGVRDFVLKKTVVLTRGKSYFARPKAKTARRAKKR